MASGNFWELSTAGFVGKGVAWILVKKFYWVLEFLLEDWSLPGGSARTTRVRNQGGGE